MTQSAQIDWHSINMDQLIQAYQAYLDAAKALAPQYAEAIGYNDTVNHDDYKCDFTEINDAHLNSNGSVTVSQPYEDGYVDDYSPYILTIPSHIILKHLQGVEWLDEAMKQAAIQRAVKAARQAEEALKAKQAEVERVRQSELAMLRTLKARYPDA